MFQHFSRAMAWTCRSLVVLALMGSFGSAVAADVQLLSNGSFEKTDKSGFPEGWKFGDPAICTIESEEGRKFLRLHLDSAGAAITSQRVGIDPASASVTLNVKLRARNLKIGDQAWKTGRVQVEFLDTEKKHVGGWNAINLAADQDWAEHTLTLDLPKGAAWVDVQCGMWGASGTVDFDDISLTAKPKELPVGQRLKWEDRSDKMTRSRSQIDLAGDWLFKNAEGDSAEQPSGGWSVRSVPGSVPAPIRRMWYERDVRIPIEWSGRRIELSLQRVSTDAKLWVNGQPAADYAWPGGVADITKMVKFGQPNTIRLLVVAVDDRAEVEVLMGYATNAKAKAELKTRGLIGPVTLRASPAGARATDVQLRASVADRTLYVDIESEGGTPETVSVTVSPTEGGAPAVLKQSGPIAPGVGGRVRTASFQWPDVKLWDVGQPNLYRVAVDVTGANGLDDQLVVPAYGFREFRIDGRQFLLNGTRIHLRPGLLGSSSAGVGVGVRTLFDRGFNFGEIWPEDLSRRGTMEDYDATIAEADRVGLLISGNAMHMRETVNKWDQPAARTEYARQMEPYIRRWRNSPSIVMWGTSGNAFQNQADGAPQNIGKRDYLSQQEYADQVKRYDVLAGMIKALDPTRPIFAHFGLYTGDVYTSNMYLNFIPLQEREEWLTEWSKNGQMPFMAVEFGVPFWSTWTRGRDGFPQSGQAEVFLSEWAARYLGKEAYSLEPAAFRALLAERYVGGNDRRTEYGKVWWWDLKHHIFTRSESFRRVQDLYVTNTWRAWRTLGVSGGMIPWDNGMEAPALSKVNGPTLAWIAGPEDAPLAKDHHFSVGSTIRKQAILINDTRSPQPYEASWEARIGGEIVGSKRLSGSIEVGAILRLPIEFASNQSGVGSIHLTAKIGATTLEDRFSFRVFDPEPPVGGVWYAFDRRGDTTQLLKGLGYTVEPWTSGMPPAGATVVVGQRALSGDGRTGQRDLPADLTEFVRSGGRLLVMGQDPDWMRHSLHLRVANHVARRAFAVDPRHPVLAGIDDEAMRDWNGSGSLVESYPKYSGYEWTLQYGWRNGNRGSVSSAAIEKPHRSSLRPIVECEFDLAYSPLMEMEFGTGRVTVCTFDFEARTEVDPAATKLARQMFEHVRTAAITPKAKRAAYIGNDDGAAVLSSLGVRFLHVDKASFLPDDLVIVGGGPIDEPAIRAWVEAGGRAVVLPRVDVAPIFGATFLETESFHGSASIPDWPEAAGLSASDLHFRADAAVKLVQAGKDVEVAADGLLARAKIGRGGVTFVQAGPHTVPADEKRYFRFTRWRLTRTLSQVLSNAGATFEQDAQLLKLLHEPDHAWMLAGQWNGNLTAPQPESPRREWRSDPGTSDTARKLIASGDLRTGEAVPVPAYMESYGPAWRWVDGEVVFRKQIDIPARLAGRDLYWSLGRVDEKETSYLNGTEIGSSLHWQFPRGHKVPGAAVKAGTNTLAVRVFDSGIHGGMCGDPSHLYLRLLPKTEPGFYHPDYINDGVDESATDIAGWERAAKQRAIADNPYRYYRW